MHVCRHTPICIIMPVHRHWYILEQSFMFLSFTHLFIYLFFLEKWWNVLCPCIRQETNRLEYLIPKKTSLRHRLPMGDQGFIDFVAHLLEVNPKERPSASEALKHPWLSHPYEPISAWKEVIPFICLIASAAPMFCMGVLPRRERATNIWLPARTCYLFKVNLEEICPFTCLHKALKGVFGFVVIPFFFPLLPPCCTPFHHN